MGPPLPPVQGVAVTGQTPTTLKNGVETPVSSTSVQVLAANPNRKAAIIQCTGAGNARVGASGVTATTGMRVKPDGHVILRTPFCPTNAVFAIREGATDTIVLAMELV